MSPEECLLRILDDAGKMNEAQLQKLSRKQKDRATARYVDRWLGWISSVNQPDWMSYEEEE